MRSLGIFVLLMVSLSIIPSRVSRAASPLEKVREATESMNQWLGVGGNADAWRRFLHVEELTQLLGQGKEADPAKIMSVLSRFRQPVAGIDSPDFVAVRNAVQEWLNATATDQSMADWVGRYSTQFAPISDERVQAARQGATKAAAELEKMLAYGTAVNTQAWHDFLLWDSMQGQLKSDTSPDAEALGSVVAKLYSGQPGLELSEFVKLRDALLSYRRLLMAKSDPAIQKRFADQLKSLSAELAEPRLSPSQIATRLVWLEQLGQTPEIVSEVRNRYGKANFYFSASAETVSKGLAEKIEQNTPLNEMILGTRIQGVAHTVGNLSAQLIPYKNKAAIEVLLTGVSDSNTVGRRKPVSIYSLGKTQILGRKLLLVDAEGVIGEPATASCSTDSQIYSIRADHDFGSKLIEKIAWKQARKQQGQAERISSGLAERRVASMMDEQAAELIAKSNQKLNADLRRPLRRRNIYPRWVRLSTTNKRLNVRALQGQQVQLSASDVPPQAPTHSVVVQVHESLFLNSAVNAVGGFLMTDERAQDLVKEVTGEIPDELLINEDDDPWSITFDRLQPMKITFDDGKVTIAIRGRRFTRGDQVVRKNMQVAATYRVTSENGKARLIRDGDIDVTYPGKEGQRLSLTELRNKTFMTKKFEGLFKSQIDGEGLKLPERLRELEDLKLDYVSSADGWLTLGWN